MREVTKSSSDIIKAQHKYSKDLDRTVFFTTNHLLFFFRLMSGLETLRMWLDREEATSARIHCRGIDMVRSFMEQERSQYDPNGPKDETETGR